MHLTSDIPAAGNRLCLSNADGISRFDDKSQWRRPGGCVLDKFQCRLGGEKLHDTQYYLTA